MVYMGESHDSIPIDETFCQQAVLRDFALLAR